MPRRTYAAGVFFHTIRKQTMLKPFSLDIDPTFKAKVKIPVPGKAPYPLEFTFKHMDKDAFKAFGEKLGEFDSDTDAVMHIACGWELDDPWDREHIDKLVTKYLGSARAIIDRFAEENSGAAVKN